MRLRRRQTKLIYPNHRSPPWFIEAAARDRSNRWLDAFATQCDTHNRHASTENVRLRT